jgi:glycerol uptake operon antiterminator
VSFFGQDILPAVRKMREIERLMESEFQYMILLDVHLGQIKAMVQLAKQHGKKVILHADLIQGLKSDAFATEFLCQEIKPAGIISTKANVVLTAKKKGILAIQRLFLIDSMALENSYSLLEKTKPDYIEILPGVMPHIIKEVNIRTGIPVLAGGLIRNDEDVRGALSAGAVAVTTSRTELWK